MSPYNAYGVNDTQIWNSNNPTGSVVTLDFPFTDNGSVVTTYSSTDKWTFTTIHEPKYGDHPVSGNRDFGYIENTDGSHTFYTRGVDRLTSWDGTLLQSASRLPFSMGDALWRRFQENIYMFVHNHQGYSSKILGDTFRPNWPEVKNVLDGTKPVSTIAKNCPD